MLNFLISFDLGEGVQIKSYDPVIIKEWLNSYPYLYKGFTPNKGQLATMDGKIAENVVFYSKNGNMGIFITENGLSYVIYDIEKKEVSKDNKELSLPINKELENSILHYARIDYELIGGKIKKENIIYQDELPGYENFYLAHCPDGILFVKSYRKVIIKDVYPGINWIFRYDDNGNFHHEFEIKNPQLISQIKLKVKYADIELVDNGKSIILSTPIGKIKDGSLRGYQGNNIVEVSYRLKENNLLTFDISNYDRDKSLLIDPHALIWSTYYGGSGTECYNYSCSITTDIQNNIFLTGSTISNDFPTYNGGNNAYYQGTIAGNIDAFILKFSNSGVRQWATYYGGNNKDYSSSITTDIQGNVFITGYTISSDFPTYNPSNGAYFDGNCEGCPYFYDPFILKFNNLGVRQWATYYGGGIEDRSYSITTDIYGNIFVTGYTESLQFPTYNPGGNAYYQENNGGGRDVFILKFDNSGNRLWATYYGGSQWDEGWVVLTDNDGDVFLTGRTYSPNFPVYYSQNGAYFDSTCGTDGNCNGGNSDLFILKFNNSGVRLWATYYGGSSNECYDFPFSLAIDVYGNVFIVGYTTSIDFPTYNPGGNAYYQGNCNGCPNYDDIFILKFDNSGIRQWATYYGGSNYDYASSITIDANGNVFVSGWTWSDDFPVQNYNSSYFQSNRAGYEDIFILKFNNLGQKLWATYFGGSGSDFAYYITNDSIGNVFITGRTLSNDFPLRDPNGGAYYQGSKSGGYDAFISKFGNSSSISEKFNFYYKDRFVFNLESLSTPITIKIYSLDGKLIYSKIFKTNNIEIKLKTLKSGIYILKAYSSNNKQLTYKFIKN
ncbi:MAG: SBBP repeat-containing protein [candidate division WOR-3 bacterium]